MESSRPATPPMWRTFHTSIPVWEIASAPLIEVAPGHHVAFLRRPVGGTPALLSIPG
jgi:hypothetical protein